MSRTDWVPASDSGLDLFCQNFSTRITATPIPFGLVAGDATAFATNKSDFTTKLGTASNPSTATKVATAAKNTSRSVLIANLRALAKRVQATSGITASQLSDLGLTVRDTVSTPVPAPATKPLLSLMNTISQQHDVRAADITTPASRARPAGASGLQVFYQIDGETTGADVENWHFELVASKADFSISYPASAIGKIATVRARWMNRRGEVGPLSDPITGTVAA